MDICVDRRGTADRRQRRWWSLVYGSFNPRRRRPARRADDSRFHSTDWHAAHLLAVALGILMLCAADAFLTITLMFGGAVELNPLMGAFVHDSAALFAAVKMAFTSFGVILMVVLAEYRFMRLVRVEWVLYAVLLTYSILLGYELQLLENVDAFIEL